MNQSKNSRDDQKAWCKNEATSMFDFIRATLDNQQLLADYGFANENDVKGILILVVAGDGLHPNKGPKFLGDSWHTLDRTKLKRAISARNRIVGRMTSELLEALRNGASYENACRLIENVPYQVIHLVRDEPSLLKALKGLHELGVSGPFGDTRLERIADALLFGFGEDYSYFMDGC